MATLQAEHGMFVAMRRPSPQADWKVSDYSPCPFCKVWVLRTLLTKHQKNCVVRNNKETTDKLPCINEHKHGMFVAMRRPSPQADWKVSDYSPCPFCNLTWYEALVPEQYF